MLYFSFVNRPGTHFQNIRAHLAGRESLDFSLQTYDRICESKSHDYALKVVYPINAFFETLTTDQSEWIYEFYLKVKMGIHTGFSGDIRKARDYLCNEVDFISAYLELPERMVKFCQSDIFLYPNLERPVDRKFLDTTKTFDDHDLKELTAVALFTKLMIPVFGELHKFFDDLNLESRKRNQICNLIIYDVLMRDTFMSSVCKLRNLIDFLTDNILRNKISLNAPEVFSTKLDNMSSIVTKRMAIHTSCHMDEDGRPPHLLRHIDSAVKRYSFTRVKQLNRDKEGSAV